MENVTPEIDPRIVQGLLTLVAAFIASITALIVAFAAYPRQKKIDRFSEALKERREIYREFICAVEAAEHSLLLYVATEAGEKLLASDEATSIALGKIYVSSPDAAASLARETHSKLYKWIQAAVAERKNESDNDEWFTERVQNLKETYLSKKNELVAEMRKETYPNTSIVNVGMLSSVLLDMSQVMDSIGRITRK